MSAHKSKYRVQTSLIRPALIDIFMAILLCINYVLVHIITTYPYWGQSHRIWIREVLLYAMSLDLNPVYNNYNTFRFQPNLVVSVFEPQDFRLNGGTVSETGMGMPGLEYGNGTINNKVQYRVGLRT